MIHKEIQILDLSKKVLDDLNFDYIKKEPFYANYSDEPSLDANLFGIVGIWTVSFKWFNDDYLDGMEVSGFLQFEDKSGEPIVLRLATGGGGNCLISKNEKGRYFVKSHY